MYTELGNHELDQIYPLLQSVPPDPMLYMLLEGVRPGQTFVDRVPDPDLALIWTGMEYAYLIVDPEHTSEFFYDPGFARDAFVDLLEDEVLPALGDVGLDFLTIFPFGIPASYLQDWFPDRKPVSYGVNAFNFDLNEFERLKTQAKELPESYILVRLDGKTLPGEAFFAIREDITFCWDSLARFEALGLGFAVQDPDGQVVSTCYAIGVGADAYHIDIWTHPDHRRKGLAHASATAFLEQSLASGRTIYWINDAPNTASRRLAESLGFVYTGDLATVDIPVFPGTFHLGLAEHFADYLGLYEQAGELYDTAFELQGGVDENYNKAAVVWDQAGDAEKAEMYRHKAGKSLGPID